MKRFKLTALTTVLGSWFFLITAAGLCQEDIETVRDSSFKELTRPAVAFFHDAHNEKAAIEECNVCHHMFEDGKKLEHDDSVGMECSQCHYANTDDSVAGLIRVYHLQCSGCHLKQKAGPVMCGECHLKH